MQGKNPVGWFEIYVQDMARAKKFYESVFQFELENLSTPDADMLAFPMVREGWGAAGSLVKMEGVAPGGGGTMVYFTCDDCAVEESRVPRAGGKIKHKKMPIGEHGFISLVSDTEGNTFGLHSMH